MYHRALLNLLIHFSKNQVRNVIKHENYCSHTRKAVFPASSTAVSPALANLLTQPVRQTIRIFFTSELLLQNF